MRITTTNTYNRKGNKKKVCKERKRKEKDKITVTKSLNRNTNKHAGFNA